MNQSYSLPLAFGDLMRGERINKVSTKESIYEYLYLILMTSMGQHRFNPNFGCTIWEKDFDICTTEDNWIHELEKSLQTAIDSNESRLFPNFKIEVEIIELEETKEEGASNIIKYFQIIISELRLKATNELIEEFHCTIAFSPVVLE